MVDLNIRAANGPGFNPIDGEDDLFAGDFDLDLEEMLLIGPANSDRSEKIEEVGEVRVFPNPVSDQFSINADTDIQSWSLHSSLGGVVMRAEVGAPNTVVQVNELPSGVYFLIVQTSKGSVKRKVEVIR